MTATDTYPAAEPTAAQTVRRYWSLTWFLCGVGLQRLVVYRTDFLLGGLGFLVRISIQALLIGVIFNWVPELNGWSREQVLFLFGFALLPRGLDRLFTDQLWLLGENLIRTGDFYRYLVRPVNPLYAVLSERFLWPDAFGELIIGVLLVGYAGSRLGVDFVSVDMLVVAPLCVLAGAVIYASVKLICASLAFWATVSFPTMHAVNQLSDFVGYPLPLYPLGFQWFLSWVVPFAFTSSIPAAYLLFGDRDLLVWLPVVTVAVLALALTVWRRGLARYESTGS